MSNNDALQEWTKENGVKGIRFYPSNASTSSVDDILDGAHKAIQALESGVRIVAYEDTFEVVSS